MFMWPHGTVQHRQPRPHIQLLPNEILVDIFLLVIREWFSEAPWRYLREHCSTTSPAWTLSHVCRHWRSMTFLYPKFWSFIMVVISKERLVTNTVRMQFSFARGEPLTTIVMPEKHHWNTWGCCPYGGPSILDTLEPFWNGLFVHTQTLWFCLPPGSLSLDAFMIDRKYFRGLTTLRLSDVSCVGDRFADCSLLRKVSIGCKIHDWRVSPIHLPWSRLTSFSLAMYCCDQRDQASILGALAVLKFTVALQSLALLFNTSIAHHHNYDEEGWVDLPDMAQPDTLLSNLRSLSLQSSQHTQDAWIPFIFHKLIVPRLQHLTLDLTERPLSLSFHTHVSFMLQRSTCNLRSVCLALERNTTQEAIKDLLLTLSSIQVLTVVFSNASNPTASVLNLIQTLTINGPNAFVLPCLSTLLIRDLTGFNPHPSFRIGPAIAELYRSRCSTPIMSLILSLQRRYDAPPILDGQDAWLITQWKAPHARFSLTDHARYAVRIPELDPTRYVDISMEIPHSVAPV